MESEKQSSAEPISLFELLSREGSSITSLPRINVSSSVVAACRKAVVPPPPSPPAKRFLSISLPSSPRSTSLLFNKKIQVRTQSTPPTSDAISREPKQEKDYLFIGRSKSCGELKANRPSIEYEVHLRRVHTVNHHGSRQFEASFSKRTEAASNTVDKGFWGFKCGSLCFYLPAFIKGKPLTKKEAVDIQEMISRTMSREKFECGSWSAAAIVNANDDIVENHSSGDEDYCHDGVDHLPMNMYYELPPDMMDNGSKIEPESHFEKTELKGILINSLLKERKSNTNSMRHVRFSTETPTLFPSSPPSCITPRLRLAREEFNAFLEAQHV